MCWKIRRNLSACMGGLVVGRMNTEHGLDGQSISATQIKLYDSHLNSSSRESLLVYQFSFCCIVAHWQSCQEKCYVQLSVRGYIDIVVCSEITLAACHCTNVLVLRLIHITQHTFDHHFDVRINLNIMDLLSIWFLL